MADSFMLSRTGNVNSVFDVFKCLMGCLSLKLFKLSVMFVSTARHGLDCPQSIKAREGGSVTIQCRVDPTIDLTSCTVVLCPVGNSTPAYVYCHGNDDPGPVLEDYRDRVTLNKEDLPKGVVTLQISLLNRSDSGPYRVFVKGLGTCMFNLTVGKSAEFLLPRMLDPNRHNIPDNEELCP
uniref:Immunoglobulin domain-containing protein n=1 Tax=Monopterus albus TaxID=43700 RepID=A0A3Q3IQ96_MONAL